MSQNVAKEAASIKALEFVQDGMLLGLGTGSTAAFFIKHLIEKCKQGLKVQAVATSVVSEDMAKAGNIPLLDINTINALDLTIDGADEIDPQKRLIKGAGGALVREKIIASMSKEMVVIADETKLVDQLGLCPLPIEIIPFGAQATQRHIQELGLSGSLRKDTEIPYLTDNQNWIYDIHFSSPPKDLEDLQNNLLSIPGVVDTGFFFHLAKRCVIGKQDGTTTLLN
ncbi:MAG: ribose-5-phosphate isomerase RpiA [Simkaniaceae bacterium]|nr:ribose-5-phosphate isomerase RpiA [Candidatus Sacchlamyda saccharinae]